MIENAALEPEVADLAHCLNAMGARIEGHRQRAAGHRGSRRAARCAATAVVADRIEAGTYAMAAAITGGAVTLQNVGEESVRRRRVPRCARPGLRWSRTARAFACPATTATLTGVDVITDPFPGFPTDLQAQFMALMSKAGGASMITETIFENRYMHVPELKRMGANVNLHGASAMVRGVEKLLRRGSHGHRPAGVLQPGHRRAGRRGRNDNQPGLSPRPRLRTAGRETDRACGARVERIAGS